MFKFFVLISLFLFLNESLNAQISIEPAPDFFRIKREIPLMDLPIKKEVSVADYGALVNDGKNDIDGIKAAINAAKSLAGSSTPVRVVLEKGTYDLIPGEGRAFEFYGLEYLVVDGQGAEFLMHNPEAGYLKFENCKNLIIKNLYFDYAVLPFTQGTVTAKNVAAATFDLQIDDGFPLLSESYFERAGQKWGMLKLPSGQLKEGVRNLFPYRGWTQIQDNIFRVKQPNSSYVEHIDIGDHFVQIARNNGNGSAIYTSNSQNITYLNLTIYASSAGSFNGNNMKEWAIINCSVTPKAGRIHSTNADGVHVSGGYIGPWVEGCTFEGFSDDCVNFKHTKREILSVINSKELIVRYDVNINDELVFFNPREGVLLGKARAVEVKNLGGNQYMITLSEPVTISNISEHQTGDKCYITTRANESFVFRNNTIRNLRHAGMVIQAKYGVVENCLFENLSNVGIHIKNIADWGEGFVASDILIKNNQFINCGFDEPYIKEGQSAAIVAEVMKLKMPCAETASWCGDERSEWQGLTNITISNNDIEYNKKALNVANINGLTLEGCNFNHNPNDISLLPGEEPVAIKIENCSNVNNECASTGSIMNDEGRDECIFRQIGNDLILHFYGSHFSGVMVNMYSSTGKKVCSMMGNDKQINLSLEEFSSGIYIVEVLEAKKRYVRKILNP
jgi:hypothetical protein